MRKTILLLLLVLSGVVARAHSGKADIQVIIDTDCGSDDLRAICMMLASPRFNIHAISTSDGALAPGEGAAKVRGLLNTFYHEGIPVIESKAFLKSPPPFRSVCQQIDWGIESKPNTNKSLAKIVREVATREKIKVTLICLGSLHNIGKIYDEDPAVFSFIDRIIWYNSPSNTNYKFDKTGADRVLENFGKVETVYASDIYYEDFVGDSLLKLNSAYAEKVAKSIHTVKASHKKVNVWDEMAVLYLLHTEDFTLQESGAYKYTGTIEHVFEDIFGLLDIQNINHGKVFNGFPVEKGLYAPDVANMMDSIIHRHGMQEWRTGVLTNELHGHLGIYATVGNKMGTRVREYFRTGIDDIRIESLAGLAPPLSCMTDGLQVSTGGTLGHGLIGVPAEKPHKAAARFTFRGQTIEVTLKEEYLEQVKADIIFGVTNYGINTETYWLHVRKLALKYWKDWDRHIIFDIKVLEL